MFKKAKYLMLAGALLVSTVACGTQQTGSSSTLLSESPSSSTATSNSISSVLGDADDDLNGITLEFWNGYTGPDGEVLTDLVNRFNENNEYGITINMDIIPWTNFHEKVPQTIATGTAPDFVINGFVQLGRYLAADAYQPVDDYFTYGAVPKENFPDAVLDLFVADETLWQLPLNAYGRMYYYWNKDLFAAAGLDPEKPAQTWDEVLEIARQTTDESKGVYGFGIPIRDQSPLLHHMILAEGYAWFDETTNTSNLGNPTVQAVLEKLQLAIMNDKISPPSVTGPEMDNLAYAGQLAQYFNGPWMVSGFKENDINFGVSVVPEGSTGRQGSFEGGGFAVLKGAPEINKRAVYKFIDFMYSDDIASEWSIKTGFPPFLSTVKDKEEIKNDPIISELSKISDYGIPHYVGYAVMPQIYDDVIDPMCEKILYGGGDVATEATAAEIMMNENLNQ